MNTIVTVLLKGLAFGVTMAMIPGPIFFLIVQRTLAEGAATGFLCGLGAVTADATYALVAAIGLTFIMKFLLSYQALLSLLGGLFLIYLGIITFFQQPSEEQVDVKDTRLVSAYFSTFFLTIANPVTILSYCIMFAGLGIESASQNFLSSMFVIALLVIFLRRFKKQLSNKTLILICKSAGIILIGFGIAAIFGGAVSYYHTTCTV